MTWSRFRTLIASFLFAFALVTAAAVPPAQAGIMSFLKRHLLGGHSRHHLKGKVAYRHRVDRRDIAQGHNSVHEGEDAPPPLHASTDTIADSAPIISRLPRPSQWDQWQYMGGTSDSNDQAFSTRASWYGPGFEGKRTASGQRFNQYGLTAASRTLPLGSRLLVANPTTGKCCTVTINDRGPYVTGRDIDLSRGAAAKIGVTGVSPVVCVAYADSQESEQGSSSSASSAGSASNHRRHGSRHRRASTAGGAPLKIYNHVMHLMAGIS